MEDLLKRCGAMPVPGKKHRKYKLPNGMTYTIAATPSDRRAALNQLTLLRRLLGER